MTGGERTANYHLTIFFLQNSQTGFVRKTKNIWQWFIWGIYPWLYRITTSRSFISTIIQIDLSTSSMHRSFCFTTRVIRSAEFTFSRTLTQPARGIRRRHVAAIGGGLGSEQRLEGSQSSYNHNYPLDKYNLSLSQTYQNNNNLESNLDNNRRLFSSAAADIDSDSDSNHDSIQL